MTACPEPKKLVKEMNELHAKSAPHIRNIAENYLGMQTSDPARAAASRMQHMNGFNEQGLRDASNKAAPMRAMWDKRPVSHSWEYLKLTEAFGGGDKIDKFIGAGMSRTMAETHVKNEFMSEARDKLEALLPNADPAHIKAEAQFWADQWQMRRPVMDELFARDAQHGSEAEYKQDYIHAMYKDVGKASKWFSGRLQAGAIGHQKAKVFESMQEAVEKGGLELKHNNPIDIDLAREQKSVIANSAVDALRRLQRDGYAIPVSKEKALKKNANAKAGVDYLSDWQKRPTAEGGGGWINTTLYAADRQEWAVHPDAWNVVKNAFDKEGISGKGGVIGNAYDGIREVKNVVQPMNLGLSGFHAGHEIFLINPAQALVRAIRLSQGKGLDVWAKNMIDAGKFTMRESIVNWPLDKIGMGFGKALDEMSGHAFSQSQARKMQRWENMSPEDRAKDPLAAGYILLKQESGAKFDRPPEESSQWLKSFKDSWEKGKLHLLLPKGAMVAIESIQKPLFNHFIPGLKRAQYWQEMAALQQLHPEIFESADARRFASQQVLRNLDDRLGEMNYNNLFMKKMLKDIGVISTVSFSWNYGFGRQFAGAIANVGRTAVGRGTEIQNRMMKTDDKAHFIMAYAGLSASLAGIMTYMMTGTAPQGTDFIYPRTGRTNVDGTPGRLDIPTNFRDFPMAIGHTNQHNSVIQGLGQLLWSKMILQPYVDAVTGKDWRGDDMYDTNRPWVIRQLQLADSVLGELVHPIGIEAYKRAGEVPGAGAKEKGLAIAGFPPASKYIGYSGLDQRILQLSYDRRGAGAYQYGEKTGLGRGLVQGAIRGAVGDELKGDAVHKAQVALASAKASNDQAGIYKANQALRDAGKSKGSVKYNNPQQQVEKAFAYLPLEDQQQLAKGLSAKDFNRLVTSNSVFKDRKIKPNQQRLIKDRGLP